MAEYSMANRKIAYTLGSGWDMLLTRLQLVATWVQNIFRNVVSYFDMSSTSGNMGAKYSKEFGPIFLPCHVPNLACHGVGSPTCLATLLKAVFFRQMDPGCSR